ncbi:MAG: Mur ligase domain-containing protein, partial [Bacteroides sp.]
MNIKNLYQYYKTCQGVVSTDSRNCPLGSLFFALKGDKFDGNQYAAQALATGAAYAVVDKPEVVDKESGRYLLVHDTLYALQQLANYHRQMLHTPIL